MAKVKGGLHSDNVGGALGKSMIFRKGKKSTTVMGYYKPGSAKKFDLSYPQLANRDKYGQIVQAWKALTTEQQEVFNENAKGTEMSGWNLFMKTYGEQMFFRIPLTIDKTKVGGALTDYPMYIDLSLLGDHFWAYVKNGGGDIRIKMSDGTECPLEIVSCDTALKTGEVWAKLPTLGNSTNTIVYISYGNSANNAYGVNDTYGSKNVWGSNAKYIGHLQANANDSSANASNGTVTGPTSVNAKIYKGYDFDGTANKIISNNAVFDLTKLFTLSMWYIRTTNQTINGSPIFDKLNGYSSGNVAINTRTDGGYRFFIRYGAIGDGSIANIYNIPLNTPINIVWIHRPWNGSDHPWSLYLNGVLIGNYNSANQKTLSRVIDLGSTITYNPFIIDEVRLFENVDLPAIRILTDYNNQNSPSTFYAVGQYQYTI